LGDPKRKKTTTNGMRKRKEDFAIAGSGIQFEEKDTPHRGGSKRSSATRKMKALQKERRSRKG